MVKIRLRRVGARSKPMYRIVVTDSRSPRDGAFIEIIGHYNPLVNPEAVDIDKEKADKWLKTGAQLTNTAARLFIKAGILDKSKVKLLQKTGVKKKQPAAAPAAAAPAEAATKETAK
jgi:small subunit ribosomal protein S16